MILKTNLFLLALLCLNPSLGHSTQHPSGADDDDGNPLLDMASMFLQEALTSSNNNGDSGGGVGSAASIASIASIVGSLMEANNGGHSKSSGGSGAMQIISGIGKLLTNTGNNNGDRSDGGTGFDPSIIGNVLEMFTQNDENEIDYRNQEEHQRNKRKSNAGLDLGSILKIVSAFMGPSNEASSSHHNQQKRPVRSQDSGLMSLVPLVVQVITSFTGDEGKRTQAKHKEHAWVLPPFLEKLHVLWDHFSTSNLADALYEKSGVNKILNGFRCRDGKINYEKLLESLNNQSFRRRWIKSATVYLADWASYLGSPEVYTKYFNTTQLLLNSFLKSQGFPKSTFIDSNRPTETISNLLDHVAKHHINIKVDTRQYVKPFVNYAKDLIKLGQARGLLQFNATEISDQLTDTLNLEVIEPVLKVHRAYRYAVNHPQCDSYVLCQLNDRDQYSAKESRSLIAGVTPKIIKVGSIGAAFFISTETGIPFRTLFDVITSASDCAVKYPVDCSGFHEGEAKVTREYIHTEL